MNINSNLDFPWAKQMVEGLQDNYTDSLLEETAECHYNLIEPNSLSLPF